MEQPNNSGGPNEKSSRIGLPKFTTRFFTFKKASSLIPLNPFKNTDILENDKQAEIQDLLRLDKNKRTLLHRAALDQNVELVEQLCTRAKNVEIAGYVDILDKFGNSALLTSCVINNEQTNKDKLECINILIKNGCNPNQRNDTTLWTPLTWCAYYGDKAAITKLLSEKAVPYLPDKDGYFPLDHCGLQDKGGNRKEAAEILIEGLIKMIEEFDAVAESATSLAEQNPNESKEHFEHKRYLRSPLLRSSLFYWAVYFKLDLEKVIGKLLKTDGVYPDLPLKTIFGRNGFHACSYHGNFEALSLLLDKDRYLTYYLEHLRKKKTKNFGLSSSVVLREEEERVFDFTEDELKREIYSREFLNYHKFAVQWILKCEDMIVNYVTMEVPLPKFHELQDIFGNSPLHVASFLGKAEIVEILLQKKVNIHLENKDAWRCEDLTQYPTIKKLYQDYVQGMYEEEMTDLLKQKLDRQVAPSRLASRRKRRNTKKRCCFWNCCRSKKVDTTETARTKSLKMKETLEMETKFLNEQRIIPDVVLLFQTNYTTDNKATDGLMERINFNISLIRTSFDCYLTSNVDGTKYYLMIKMCEDDLEDECMSNSIKIKLLNAYGHQIYDATRKVDFEPFRSKQRQEITLTSLNKLIDIQQLKDIGVLNEIYSMHTVSGINRIRETWLKFKGWWPEPLASFKDYFQEGKHINFTAITTLRMYFGEKVSFFFAWASFYTCFLVVLAVPGLGISIALFDDSTRVSYLLPIWVIYNSLCSTLVVERWKRKSAEIATRWGTVDLIKDNTMRRVVRTEYIGDEVVHETTGAITKFNPSSHTALYFLISLPILFALLAGVVGSFLGVRYIQQEYSSLGPIVRMLISGTNGIIIAVINFLYGKMARYFVNKENHKYADTYEKSLIFKVFTFQFLNSYLGVFYLLFIENEDLGDIHLVLISLLISKQISAVVTGAIIPWLTYKIKKIKYFMDLESHARKHYEQRKDKLTEETAKALLKDLTIQRPVLNCSTGTPEKDQWDISRVELNALRVRNDEFVDEFGQMFTQCGYITIFAPAFPMGPVIGLIANIIDIRAKLFALLYTQHRPPIEKAGDIGVWQDIWEIMSIVGIMVNAVILFFNSSVTIDFLEDILMIPVESFNPHHDIRRLWVFIIIVHFIIILKLIVRAFINDKPGWVITEEKKQNNEEKLALQIQKTGQTLLNIDNSQDSIGKSQTLKNIREDFQDAGQRQLLDNLRPTSLKKEASNNTKQVIFKPVPVESLNSIEDGPKKPKEEGPKQVHHATPQEVLPLASIALELNYGIKTLLFNAFCYIEKELMMRRLASLTGLIKEVVIKCDVCKKEKALLECQNCNERYCDKCLVQVHNKTVQTSHQIVCIVKYDPNSLALKDVVIETAEDDKGEANSGVNWQKVETFAFPTYKGSDNYNDIERMYKILQKIYIEDNGISLDNTITNVELALKLKNKKQQQKNKGQPDQQEGDVEESVDKKEIINAFTKQLDLGEIDFTWLGQVQRFFEMPKFNTEEKLWMNRVAFMVFKKRGAKTSLNDFHRQLKILEEGTLEAKMILLFDLIDEDGDGLVSVNDLLKLFSVAFLQNMKTKNNQDEILKEVFKGLKKIDKKAWTNLLIQNVSAKDVLRAYLQVKNEVK